MSNFNFFGGISAFLLMVCTFCLFFAACSSPESTEVANPDNKWIKVDGTMVHEIHPRLGVTCYVVYNNGISCLKD